MAQETYAASWIVMLTLPVRRKGEYKYYFFLIGRKNLYFLCHISHILTLINTAHYSFLLLKILNSTFLRWRQNEFASLKL
jgi:hypothetical protein